MAILEVRLGRAELDEALSAPITPKLDLKPRIGYSVS